MNGATAALVPLISCLAAGLISCDRCCQINSRQLPQYKLVRSNARSTQLILSRRTVRNLNECKAFALAKKALAFNYGLETDPFEWDLNVRSRNAETSRNMCQALQCPEIHNFTTLVRDRNYKYYSIYPGYIATGNGTTNFTLVCIPRTGVFIFSSNNLNYSQAQISCQKFNASLAHIISEERTNGLAKYISQNTPTLVGLSNRDHKSSWKNEFDEPLSCFNYRSWGEGQPSHAHGCVSLVQPFKSKPGPFWKVVSCDSALPFICEVSPIYKSISNMFI
ncbi:uncharacterized protein LOC143372917 [Andrena cerasifolii]|uniref:uncharacterized protein LOC143372917 n=1 Tax=Andrena cerasifolii TaxID=2819439 RepID=UPI004038428D